MRVYLFCLCLFLVTQANSQPSFEYTSPFEKAITENHLNGSNDRPEQGVVDREPSFPAIPLQGEHLFFVLSVFAGGFYIASNLRRNCVGN